MNRESPWRDPFAEAPLRAAEQPGGGVLLYSLGPDLEDQRGQIAYKPVYWITDYGTDVYVSICEYRTASGSAKSGRTIGAGDILLELKR